MRDEDENIVLDENGKCIYGKEVLKGYGCSKVLQKGGFMLEHCFVPITESNITIFFSLLELDGVDKERSYFTSWNDKTQKVEIIYGKIPPLFKEVL